jgi:chromosome segregation ATPase
VKREAIRSYIEDAHKKHEALKKLLKAAATPATAEESKRLTQSLDDILHSLIHAVDLIEKRVDKLDAPLIPDISPYLPESVKKQADRLGALAQRARTRASSMGQSVSQRIHRRKEPSAATPELQNEVAELKGEIHSIREAMETLLRRIEQRPDSPGN